MILSISASVVKKPICECVDCVLNGRDRIRTIVKERVGGHGEASDGDPPRASIFKFRHSFNRNAARQELSSDPGRYLGVGFREPLSLGRYARPRCFRLPPILPASSSLASPPCHAQCRTGLVGRSRSSTTAIGSSPGVTAIGCVSSPGMAKTGPTRWPAIVEAMLALSERRWLGCRLANSD